MDLGIRARRAVVCAASSGLGRGVAEALLSEGCEVTILARDRARLECAAGEMETRTGARPHTHAVDVSDGAAVDAFVEMANAEGAVDILVTNSGGPPAKPFVECTMEDWSRAVDLMLLGTVRMIRGFLPGMRVRGWGRIVCITSLAAKQPIENLVLSSAVRAAVSGMAKGLANEVGADGVLVNVAAPGYHLTPALDRLIERQVKDGTAASREEVIARWTRGVPVGRLGDPAHFGRAAAFLCSDACPYIVGHNLLVDGGEARTTF
jgi:3-oxoacyl-[acyl-carrier protein] reductase